MKRLRTWLLERFLPAWAKDSVYQENKALLAQVERQKQEIRELNAFIDGLETAMRRQRIIIQTGGATREYMERAEQRL